MLNFTLRDWLADLLDCPDIVFQHFFIVFHAWDWRLGAVHPHSVLAWFGFSDRGNPDGVAAKYHQQFNCGNDLCKKQTGQLGSGNSVWDGDDRVCSVGGLAEHADFDRTHHADLFCFYGGQLSLNDG